MNRFGPLLVLVAFASMLRAWDYEGHRIVNNLAVEALPLDFPAFAKTPEARERIAFLSGEPDRWRNSTNYAARHCSSPEHYIDLDDLPQFGLDEKRLTPFRYDFMALLGEGRVRHATNFGYIDPLKDQDRTRQLVGFLPWAINESYAKLESAFAYLRELEAAGSRDDVAQARQNVVYLMGVFGHYVGDAAQPLHTTRHFNGWVGPNPKGYRTNRTIHAWIDGGFLRAMRLNDRELRDKMRPARALWNAGPTNIFPDALDFIRAQESLVESVYVLDRDGALSPGNPKSAEGKEFMAAQMVKGAQFLSDLWYSAWKNAPQDTFLRKELARRKNGTGKAAEE
jgi:hypothetical protein